MVSDVDRKKAYEVSFKQAMKNYLMSVDRTYLAIILEIRNPQDMFELWIINIPRTTPLASTSFFVIVKPSVCRRKSRAGKI